MIYLSHPYGGNEDNRLDAALIAGGIESETEYAVFNPLSAFAKYSGRHSEDTILAMCKGALTACKLIILCPGWEKSRGCRYERMVARAYGIPRIYLTDEEAWVFRALANKFAAVQAA